MGFKKGWKAYKASKKKGKGKSKSKPKSKSRSSKSSRGNPRKMSKPKRTIPIGRTIGTVATGVLMAVDAIQPNPVIEAALSGDFVGAGVNLAQNVAQNYHPLKIFANASPALFTNIAGGILDKMKMNKSVEVMGYRFKGL